MPTVTRAQTSVPSDPAPAVTDDYYYPWTPLPGSFRKGVNLGFAYGNHIDQWLIKPDSLWNGNYLTGAGHDVNNTSRLSQLFTSADFEMLRHGTSTQGDTYFDHVIFNIDPRTFGANPVTGEVPSNMGLKVDGHDVGAIWNALVADIEAAKDAGLNVIIAMHCVVASAKHAESMRINRAPDLVEGMDGTRLYPGPYRIDLFARGTGIVPTTIGPNHPLPTFWRSFVSVLKNKTTVDKRIMFRVGSESLVLSANMFGTACLPAATGVDWFNQQGAFDTEKFNRWKVQALEDYRQIELYAVRAIWQELGEQETVSRIIVGPGIPFPSELHKRYEVQDINSGTLLRYFRYQPYVEADFINAQFPSELVQQCWQLVYVIHQYDPWWYTHPQLAQGNPPPTPLQLQYEGYGDGQAPNTARSYLGTVPPVTTPDPPFKYPDYLLRALTNPRAESPVYTVSDWRTWYNNPPMIVTEFGVAERGYNDILMMPPPSGGGDIDPTVLGAHDLMRAKWHYDVRTWLESRGIGWSVWNIFAGWNAMNGRLETKTNSVWDFHPASRYQPLPVRQGSTPPEFFPKMDKALFGDERPQ